jgi:glutamate/aspartate transport system permease protein
MIDLNVAIVIDALPYLWQGLQYTFVLTASSIVGGIVLGTVLALMRLSPFLVVRLISAGYVNLIRSIPLVLVLFWFFFLMPFVFQWILHTPDPVAVGANQTAFITFIMFEAAYFSEIIRAGIQSVSKGQFAAAQALGMSSGQTMWQVILPQAFRNMVPLLLTQSIILFQDTSLVYVLSATDFVGAAGKIARRDSTLVEMYIFVAICYLVLCVVFSYLVRRLHQKIKIIR